MDKIIIEDLEVYGYHGVYKEENKMGQKFLISITLHLDLRQAGKNDDLYKTINYGKVCQEVHELFLSNKNSLLEKCAEEIGEFILLNYELVKNVDVKVKKPWAPIGKMVDYVAVNIQRSWHKCYIGIGSNLGDKENNISVHIVEAIIYAKEVGAQIIGIVGKDGGYTAINADTYILIPVIDDQMITPYTESFHSVLCHLLVSHPKLKMHQTKWESVK